MSTRKGPNVSAKNYNFRHIMKGLDGNMWIIKLITIKMGQNIKDG